MGTPEGCFLKTTPGNNQCYFYCLSRISSYPLRVMSIAKPHAKDLIPDSKQGRMEFRPTLSFFDDDKAGTFQPHDDALVVTLRIGEYNVKRVLVDQGSGA